MNTTKRVFPQLTDMQVMLSTVKTDEKLLKEAEQKGFYNGETKYNKLFNTLFFKGGEFNWKSELDMEYRKQAYRYVKALMHSFEPRHEEKEAIVALLLSELVEV